MKKGDLKTGMVVITREGGSYVVIRDTIFDGEKKDVLWQKGGWMPLEEYSDDMECIPHDYCNGKIAPVKDPDLNARNIAWTYDIMAVLVPAGPSFILATDIDMDFNNIIWTRGDGDIDPTPTSFHRIEKIRKGVQIL